MKIAVIGAGSLGSMYRACFARDGHTVVTLAEIVGPGRVMAGLSFHSGDIVAPGHVRHTNHGPTYIGEIDCRRTERLAQVVGMLVQGDLEPVEVEDIMTTIWSKFVHNCGINAVCAVAGLVPNQIAQVPELDELQTRIIAEVVALARARGVTLPEADPTATIKAYCASKGHRVSMLQHILRGRPTEIDALNGYVARESERLGLEAPYNRALAMMVRGRELGARFEHPVRDGKTA